MAYYPLHNVSGVDFGQVYDPTGPKSLLGPIISAGAMAQCMDRQYYFIKADRDWNTPNVACGIDFNTNTSSTSGIYRTPSVPIKTGQWGWFYYNI